MAKKDLSIWIPTYNRKSQLIARLKEIQNLELWNCAYIYISDNASSNFSIENDIDLSLLKNIEVIARNNNISAGANFLRAFEIVDTKWVHIMSDDDSFLPDYIATLNDTITSCDDLVAAIKFDSALYNSQERETHRDILSAIQGLKESHINDWFNNLLLISNWVFNKHVINKYLYLAYIAYGTKLSHLIPILESCEKDQTHILFTDKHLIAFNVNEECWPKAPSWVEMSLNTQLCYGTLSLRNRLGIHRCLFNGSYIRLLVKILRIRSFYRCKSNAIMWYKIIFFISLLSARFFILSILIFPILCIPVKIWPRYMKKRLGSHGSLERW